ncbi:hypothetical protein PIB30_084478 [Stylosanthes scabra]|uniref:Uncharacterized protein n=1 Tax=Stylosanthes scabra TaxID=79078 RepID=A0ABU6STW9_9FABA|nr:hypothetical protein [Stylosanthes scabra]
MIIEASSSTQSKLKKNLMMMCLPLMTTSCLLLLLQQLMGQQLMGLDKLKVMQVMERPPQRITSSRRVFEKKRKQADILERMADEVHESTVAQREHFQILANAISGKNEEVKMGEKLAELGFADHEAIQAVIKICYDPRLEKSFWGLTDAQKTTLTQDVLDEKY